MWLSLVERLLWVQTIVVTDDDILAITCTTTLILHHTHFAIESCPDSVTDIHLHVNPIMHTTTARPKLRGNLCIGSWHAIARQVNLEAIWKGYILIIVRIRIAPFRIKAICRICTHFLMDLANQRYGIYRFQLLVNRGLACQQILSGNVQVHQRECCHQDYFNAFQNHSFYLIASVKIHRWRTSCQMLTACIQKFLPA